MQLTFYDKMLLIFVVAKTYFALKSTNYEQFNYFFGHVFSRVVNFNS